jgi:thioredoxin 1
MEKSSTRFYIILAVVLFIIVAAVIGLLIKASLDRNTNGSDTANEAVVELVVQNGKIVHLPVQDFNAYISDTQAPVFVDFWASWCGPCVSATPFVESLAKEFAGKAHVLKVNVDFAGDLPKKYGASSIPLFLVIKDGLVKDSQVGYAASIEDSIRQMIEGQLDT